MRVCVKEREKERGRRRERYWQTDTNRNSLSAVVEQLFLSPPSGSDSHCSLEVQRGAICHIGSAAAGLHLLLLDPLRLYPPLIISNYDENWNRKKRPVLKKKKCVCMNAEAQTLAPTFSVPFKKTRAWENRSSVCSWHYQNICRWKELGGEEKKKSNCVSNLVSDLALWIVISFMTWLHLGEAAWPDVGVAWHG